MVLRPGRLLAVALVLGLLIAGFGGAGPVRPSGPMPGIRAGPPPPAGPMLSPPLLRGSLSACRPGSSPAAGAGGLFGADAVGSGIYATGNVSDLSNNSGINATLPAPDAAPGSDQFVLVAIADFLNATEAVAVGVAETGLPIVGPIAVPVAYLPNGSEIYSTSGPYLTRGSTYDFEIRHAVGDWWTLSYGSHAITGGAAWENGTYDLGTSSAAGVTCSEGVRTAPALLVALYGNGVAPPDLPRTRIPSALGIAPGANASSSYRPLSANALPQFNASLGTLDLEGTDQNASLPLDSVTVASNASFGYPGANASVWGTYVVRAIATVALSPSVASVSAGGVERFVATATDLGGTLLPASFSWQVVPASLGRLNRTTGDSVTFSAGAQNGTGSISVVAAYNCSVGAARSNVTVTGGARPTIASFTVAPAAVVVGEAANFSVTFGPGPTPVAIAYAGLPPPCRSANATRLACTAATPGLYSVTVWANASDGASGRATVSFPVDPDLRLTGFAAAPNVVTEGGSVQFQANASGGVPPRTYAVTGLPPGCAPPSDPLAFTCTPARVPGVFEVRLYANDSAGHSTSATTNLTIVPPPVLLVQLAATPNPVEVGEPTVLEVFVNGGSGAATFGYTGLPPGCAPSNTSRLGCTPSEVGTYRVTVTVTDPSGAVGQANRSVTVTAPPAAPAFGGLGPDGGLVVAGAAIAVVVVAVAVVVRRRSRRGG